MARNTPYYDDEPKGGGGGVAMGSGSSAPTSTATPAGSSIVSQAHRNATKNNTTVNQELEKLEKLMQIKGEMSAAKAKPERQAAERNANVTQEGGIKKTTYPYVGPNEFKKGGKVATASRRADGIAQRGKTKGRML